MFASLNIPQEKSKTKQKILEALISLGKKKRSFRLSQTQLAKDLGCSRKTVNQAIREFEKEGYLIKYQRDVFDVCVFIMNNLLYKNARRFKHVFFSLGEYLKELWNNVSEQKVTPIRNGNVLNPSISISITRESKKTPVFNTRGLKKLKEQEMRELMEVSPPKISPLLREITDKLRLNKLGQLKLLVFHEQVLSDAWADYKKLGKINNPFDYLVVNCIKKSENRNIPVYWDLFYTSCSRYGLTDNKKYVQDKPVAPKVEMPEYTVHRPHADKTEPHHLFAEFFKIAQQNSFE